MAITFPASAPNRRNETDNPSGDPLELVIDEFSGMVEGTIKRKSALSSFVKLRTIKGTATLTNYGIGASSLTTIKRGQVPQGDITDFSNTSVTVDTAILARRPFLELDLFQTVFDTRAEVSEEHGKKIGKFLDQALFIQAIKTGQLTTSPYGTTDGFSGGSQLQITAGDELDPAKMYAAVSDLYVKMEEKDVDPMNDDVILALKPAVYHTLMEADQIINSEYVTANGTTENGMVFKTFGTPVVSSNNLPAGKVISGHELSNTRNGNAFDGDFSSVVACAFSPRALLTAQNMPLKSDVFFDNMSKHWFVDSSLAFSAAPNRAEFAGVITNDKV